MILAGGFRCRWRDGGGFANEPVVDPTDLVIVVGSQIAIDAVSGLRERTALPRPSAHRCADTDRHRPQLPSATPWPAAAASIIRAWSEKLEPLTVSASGRPTRANHSRQVTCSRHAAKASRRLRNTPAVTRPSARSIQAMPERLAGPRSSANRWCHARQRPGLRNQNIDFIGLEVDFAFAGVQPQIDVRQFSAQLRHPLQDEASCERHGRVENHPTRFLVGSKTRNSILQPPQNIPNTARKVVAGIGEHDGSADSAEQRLTKFLFEQFDLMTHRGMGKVQLIGR